jgi:hypothetical protein
LSRRSDTVPDVSVPLTKKGKLSSLCKSTVRDVIAASHDI